MKNFFRYIYNRLKFRGKSSFPISCILSKNVKLGGGNKFHKNSIISGNIGYGTYVGPNSEIYAKVGKFCSIGSYVHVILGRHPYTYPYVTTSPMFFSLLKQTGTTFAKIQSFSESKFATPEFPVLIGNDVWINSHVCIISGISIGDGAVVLAGSVVTKDIPPYAIAGGVPAKVLKFRYSNEDIQFLENLKWWDFPIGILESLTESFSDFDKFRKNSALF